MLLSISVNSNLEVNEVHSVIIIAIISDDNMEIDSNGTIEFGT